MIMFKTVQDKYLLYLPIQYLILYDNYHNYNYNY